MMKLEADISVHELSATEFRSLAASFRDYNYQQCPSYCEAISDVRGASTVYVAVKDNETLLGLASVRLHRLPLLGGGIAYIAGGPLARSEHRSNCINAVIGALVHEFVEQRGFTLRILGNVGSAERTDDFATACDSVGLHETDRSRGHHTLLVDLDRPLDDIRDSFSKYWRRNLRRADRAEFTLRSGDSPELIDDLRELYGSLRERKTFQTSLDVEYYARVQSTLPTDERYTCLIADHNDAPIGGLLFSTLGDTCVPLIMAATQAGLKQYVAYALNWRSIEIAHERGQTRYDLGGIDPNGNSGVYDFKRGMRGVECSAPGPFERRPVGLRGLVTCGSEMLCRRLQHFVDHHRSRAAAA